MIEELLVYQEADAKLKKIENELYASEDRKKASGAKKYLDGVEEGVNKLDDRASALYAEYENVLRATDKLKDQQEEIVSALSGVKDANEAAFLLKKSEELAAKIKNLASSANALSDEMTSVMKEYASIKKTTKAAKEQLSESGKKYNELKASLADERKKVEDELNELRKKVDPELMEKYLKKRQGKIYPVVYEVRNNLCGACNMELPMAALSKLKNGGIIECDQCGRILYQSEKK